MRLRSYRTEDCAALAALFYHTVHTVNARDYTEAQLDAWADGQTDLTEWNRRFEAHDSVVAVEGDTIVGFGDMDGSGYFDRLFVHADYQRRGIGTAICDRLEGAVKGRLRTHASITARPFFERRGYRVVREQQVARRGETLINYLMEKARK